MEARTPADCLDAARRLSEVAGRFKLTEPADIAAADQLRAVQRETDHLLKIVGTVSTLIDPTKTFSVEPRTDETLAYNLAVWSALIRRCWDNRCSHVEAALSTSPLPMFAELSSKQWGCHKCVLARRHEPIDYEIDSNCDICDVPSEMFTETMVSLPYGIMVHLNSCDDCAKWGT